MQVETRFARSLLKFIAKVHKAADRALEHRAYPARGANQPPVILIAQPKSGSVFIHRALRRTLQVPFLQAGTAGVHGASIGYRQLMRLKHGNVVSREHLPANKFLLDSLGLVGIDKAVLHVRNPADAIVSWARAIDRFIAVRGMAGAVLACELAMPDDYASWSFPQKLRWQIENYMPQQVLWVENWLALADTTDRPDVLVTTYDQLAADPRAYLKSVLDHYELGIPAEAIYLPAQEVGRNNIFSTAGDKWAGLDGALRDMACDQVPAALRARFGWM